MMRPLKEAPLSVLTKGEKMTENELVDLVNGSWKAGVGAKQADAGYERLMLQEKDVARKRREARAKRVLADPQVEALKAEVESTAGGPAEVVFDRHNDSSIVRVQISAHTPNRTVRVDSELSIRIDDFPPDEEYEAVMTEVEQRRREYDAIRREVTPSTHTVMALVQAAHKGEPIAVALVKYLRGVGATELPGMP